MNTITKSKLIEILSELGITSKLKGYNYIISAIELLDTIEFSNPQWIELYKTIAVKHNTSFSCVERNIRNAFSVARNNVNNFDAIQKYVGFVNCSNSYSLSQLYNQLKIESLSTFDLSNIAKIVICSTKN